MNRKNSFFTHSSIFILAQVAWFTLLGIWIYWYITNYLVIEDLGDQFSAQFYYKDINIIVFVAGLVLLISIWVGLSLLFRYLSVQVKLTNLYDNFIGNVSHELKSPLSSIQLYLETLKARNVPPEKRKDFLDLMIKDAGRLNKLINSILEISALEQKKIVGSYEIYNAGKVFRKIINTSIEQKYFPASNLKITIDADCKVVIDQNAIKIIFDNLIDNSLKYSIEEVFIQISIKCSQNKIFIEYTDNGIGVPFIEQKKIFKKFYRIHSSDSPSVKGTGLGLYWVKELVLYHGGKISVSSKGKNRGTAFKIELPVYMRGKKRYINKLLKLSIHRESQEIEYGSFE